MNHNHRQEAEAFASHLVSDDSKGPRRRVGDKVTGRCPLPDHEDKSPSFGYDVEMDASACSCAEATGKGSALRARLGWTWAGAPCGGGKGDATGRRRSPGSCYGTLDDAALALSKRIGGAEAGRWLYTATNGVAAFAVLRFNVPKTANDGRPFSSKEYRPVRRDPDGWRVGDPPAPLPLFQLLTLGTGRPVVYVEGEKCAEAVAALGFTATTNAHGAKAADKTDFAPLAGREVRILPDNDRPGEALALAVADRLAKLSPPARPRILRLPGITGLGEGADVVDWLAWRRETGSSEEGIRGELSALFSSGGEAASAPARRTAEIVTLSDVKAVPLRPLWPGRLYLGKTAVLAGDPGLGKSCVLLDIIARVSKGSPWPDEPLPPRYREPADAVLMSAEDDEGDTIRPRLEAVGADLTRIHLLKATRHGDVRSMFRLDLDLDVMEDALKRFPETRIIGIDPISAYLGDADSHVNSDVRALLAPLGELASKYNVTILALNHLNKGGGKAIYRVSGSLAFVAAPRAGLLVVADKDDRARRLMLPTKNNLGPEATGLAYRVEPVELPGLGSLPRIAWEPDPLPVSADDALSDEMERDEDRNCRDDAAAWLLDFLRDGPRTFGEVKMAGEKLGHSLRTLERAKGRLRIRSRKEGMSGPWRWTLPTEERHEDRHDRHSQGLAGFVAGGGLRDDAAAAGERVEFEV